LPRNCIAVAAAALLLGGCAATASKPSEQMKTAQAAVSEAESAGAREVEPKLLQNARNRIESARGLMDQEEYAEARRQLEKAAADARLAKARADTADVQQAAKQINETIEMLRSRMMEEQS
jgi:hypothetical protein